MTIYLTWQEVKWKLLSGNYICSMDKNVITWLKAL